MNDEDLLLTELTHVDGAAVLTIRGEVDVTTAPRLRVSVERACELGIPVVLDMAGVTFMDSSGLTALIRASGATRGVPISVRIHRPSDSVRRVLAITGLDMVFPITHE